MPLAGLEFTYNTNGAITRTNLYYLHSDHLNTPRMATNASQALLWTWNSDEFGIGLPQDDVDGDGVKLDVPLRFPGQIFDSHSQMHYNYFRDYDQNRGRYVESDPIGLEGGLNTFRYAENNPVKLVDPIGLSAIIPFEIPWIVTVPRAPTFPLDLFPPFEESRARGQTDPVQDVKPVKPGRDCDGNCKPCPVPIAWEAPSDAHGSTGGTHWHWISWDQNKSDPECTCYPKRGAGPIPPII